MADDGFLNSEFGEIADWMAQRTIIKRMPSSTDERAHSSTEPKAMGVKINRTIRIIFMSWSIIVQSSKVKVQNKI